MEFAANVERRFSYVGGAASRLQQYIDEFGDDAKSEINKAASAHILTMDVDLEEKVSYCGCGVSSSKRLVILFAPQNLAVNIDDAFSRQNITRALQEAPSSGDGGLSYETRTDISKNYTPCIGVVVSKINELLKKEYTIEPGFEDAYAKLSASKDATRDWEKSLGSFMFQYMQGLANSLEYQKFGSDDMLQEAFNEAAESGKIAFRIVDASQMKSSYCETVFEDGVLYVQVSFSSDTVPGGPRIFTDRLCYRPVPTAMVVTSTMRLKRLSISCK